MKASTKYKREARSHAGIRISELKTELANVCGEGRAMMKAPTPTADPLANYLGWRVEVIDWDGEKRRFIVGRSTGRIPCYLEIKTRRSIGGFPADSRGYRVVNPLYRVR